MQTEKSSFGRVFTLGVQHAFAMFGCTVLVATITGLPVSTTLLCAGLGTLLFHLVTGGKVPVFLGSSFAFMGAIQAVAQAYSNNAAMGTAEYAAALPYATGGIVVAGGVYLVFGLLVRIFGVERIRSFFPPIVTGTIIILIGVMLAPVAMNNITTAIPGVSVWSNWAVTLIVLGAMFAVSLFMKGFFKLVPILIAMVVGYLVALCFGMADFSVVSSTNFVIVPEIFFPKFDLKAIMMVAPLALVTLVEHIGDIAANSAVTGNDFLKTPGLHRTLWGDGLATMLAGFLGGPANTTYSENTGVLAATKNYNPATLRVAAVLAIILSFFGQFTKLIANIPGPVMGGISIVLYGMIAAVGLRTLVDNRVDFSKTRNLLIVSVMLVFGLGGGIVLGAVPVSGTALAALAGIILNKLLPENIEKES